MPLIVDGITGVTFNDASLQGAAASPYVLKNRIINGDMRIDQRNAGASITASVTGTFTYSVDRFGYQASQASKFTMQQNAGSITPPAGYNYYLGITSSSAYTVGASDYFFVGQPIEGYNTADLAFGTANAKTITLSFWVRSSLTGTFGGSLSNYDASRSYPFSYTISSANTWEQKTITITGCTDGTWITTTTRGLNVFFGLGVGSTYSGTANAWASANYIAPTGATSVVGVNGATFYITGVQLEIGTSATPFERRLYGQELANCQRYYFELVRGDSIYFATGWQYTASQLYAVIQFPVTMRTAPTLSSNTGSNFYIFYRNGSNDPFDSFTLGNVSVQSCAIFNTTQISGTAGQAGGILSNGSSAMVAFSAEL
jgi:hypothetical protein